jgi:hypothetical protein
MTHPDAKFEKISRSNTPLYGPRKALLCGFSGKAQDKFVAMLKMAGLADLDTVWASGDHKKETVGDLMALPAGTGKGEPSALPRALVAGGITEGQLQALMTLARKTGMKQTLWAVLTPTSETWPLGRLLEELAAERQAIKKSNR